MKLRSALIAVSLLTTPFIAPAQLLSAGIEIPTDTAQKLKPATIKVLIGKQRDRVLLEAKGRYNIYDPYSQILLSSNIRSHRHYLTTEDTGLKWGGVCRGSFQIRIVPGDAQSTLLVDGIEYRGCVEIYDIQGKLHVINEVDIERYLKSTMTAQFPNEMDEEVMDAIAIVARTNAYNLVSRKMDSFWHVEAQEVGYLGYALTLQNIHVDRAINNTRHMVMTYQGAPFAATWTKDSAGRTADFSKIYRKDNHAPSGVQAPFAARDREKHAWSFTLTKDELASALGVAKVSGLDLYQDQETQKVYGIRVKDGAELRQFDFFKLQKALGSVRLKSTDFVVSVNGDQIHFKGYGEGAGVGLCLYSANAMADKGDKAPRILSTFFPNTKLQNIRTFSLDESPLLNNDE